MARTPLVEYGNMSQDNLRQANEYRVQRFLEQLDTYRWVDLDKNMDTIMKTFAFMRRLVEAFDEGEALHYEIIEP